jgi:hypothetical protein
MLGVFCTTSYDPNIEHPLKTFQLSVSLLICSIFGKPPLLARESIVADRHLWPFQRLLLDENFNGWPK